MPKQKLDLANKISLDLAKTGSNEIEIVDNPDFEFMTMRDYQREKDLLASRRMKIVTQLDGFKLDQAKKIAVVMEDTLDHILGIGKYDGEEITPFDKNQLMQTYDRSLKTIGNLVRLDSVDGSGKTARLALEVKFGNGASVKTVVEG